MDAHAPNLCTSIFATEEELDCMGKIYANPCSCFMFLESLGNLSACIQICYAAIFDTCGVLLSTDPWFLPMHRQGASLPLQNNSEQLWFATSWPYWLYTCFWYALLSLIGFIKAAPLPPVPKEGDGWWHRHARGCSGSGCVRSQASATGAETAWVLTDQVVHADSAVVVSPLSQLLISVWMQNQVTQGISLCFKLGPFKIRI